MSSTVRPSQSSIRVSPFFLSTSNTACRGSRTRQYQLLTQEFFIAHKQKQKQKQTLKFLKERQGWEQKDSENQQRKNVNRNHFILGKINANPLPGNELWSSDARKQGNADCWWHLLTTLTRFFKTILLFLSLSFLVNISIRWLIMILRKKRRKAGREEMFGRWKYRDDGEKLINAAG